MTTEHFADWDGTIRHRKVTEPVDLLAALDRATGGSQKAAPAKPAQNEDDDRDWESIIEDRWEASFDENAAQDRYDRSVYGE